jgi:FlaA1/EpsC-like NDP-sugar epimerase
MKKSFELFFKLEKFNKQKFLVRLYDALVALSTFPLALFIRLENWELVKDSNPSIILICGLVFSSKLITFTTLKISRGIWRHATVQDLVLIIKSSSTATLLSFMVIFFFNRLDGIPRSIFIIDWFLCVFFLGGPRYFNRIIGEAKRPAKMKKTVLIGGGSAGELLIREIRKNIDIDHHITGILDDNRGLHHRNIHGIPVLGSIDQLPLFSFEYDWEHAFIAIPSAKPKKIREITKLCLKSGLKTKTLPPLKDIVNGTVELTQLRSVTIEDITGRDPAHLNIEEMKEELEGRVIFITGAGGSIGSELCKQVAFFNPKKLILFDACEYFIYKSEQTLREEFPNLKIIPILGDIRDFESLIFYMKAHQPYIVIHAAAYKHVPLMEANPIEAVKTNILGTKNVAEASIQVGANRFVMISTDKAVNPTNIMGATKRIAELICSSLQIKNKTKFMTVRFGNVLGSNGSVIPLFLEQIKKGGPITVTHPEITRYFMSIPEASQLVLQAGVMGNGGEIFLLDMGKPIKIIDLAKDLINLSGLDENEIEIKFIGLRPGEKLYEELLAHEEAALATAHPLVKVAKTRSTPKNFEYLLNNLLFVVEENTNDIHKIISLIKEIVSEYSPQQNIEEIHA